MNLDDKLTEQQMIAARLLTKMAVLGCKCAFTHIITGPRVTQYFFKPDISTPLAKLFNRQEDLALAVGAESLILNRVKDEISISVPNLHPSIINFDACLSYLNSMAYNKQFVLPILMGQRVNGENFILDLSTQPHMLIAGSTGSGKSVYLAQLITSLVVQKSPKQLKLMLIDTKQLDLTLFSELPHVVEMVDKIDALHPVLDRLLRIVRQRTEQMKGIARNIIEYNALLDERAKLPYYVLIIDELADVISQDKELAKSESKKEGTDRKRIADSLKQLAQISRATGIHIIAATQRPSIRIIDGDIKANFPTRIAFKLPTGVDSRVILDEGGAESLLGQGDYLYRTAICSTIERAHSAYVQMTDIARILEQHEQIRLTLQQSR